MCNLDWDLQDANVVCRELGYSGAVAAVYNATDKNGQGTGAIWMAGVDCKGNETSLFKCNQSKIGINYCGHDQDAGVICITPGITHSYHFYFYFNDRSKKLCNDNNN